MAEGVQRFIDKGEGNAIDLVSKHQSALTLKKMMEMDITEDNVDEVLIQLRDQRCEAEEQANQRELNQMYVL